MRVLSGVVLVAAVLLPVDASATWLHATYSATHGDLVAGIWILKGSVALLAIVAALLARLREPPAADERAELQSPRMAMVAVGAILIGGIVLRLYQIDTDLWLDEVLLRARYVPLEFRQLISTYDSQNHQPLYSIMSRLSYLITGGSDWSIRLPAALFGVASLAAIWRFGARVTSATEAVLAALVLAVSYHHVWFSQNARGYTAMLFFAVIGSGIFILLCEGKGRARQQAWSYAIVMALATYTHLTAALIVVGHAMGLALATPWRSPAARRLAIWPAIALVLSGLITVVLYAPMLPQVVREIRQPTMEGVQVVWTGLGWLITESVRVLSTGVPGGLVAALIALAVLGVGVASYWRESRIVTLVMFLPVVVTLMALLAARHNLWPRFFFFASGFFVLAALRGGFEVVRRLVRWQPERVALAGACGVALVSLTTVPRAWQPKQQFRAAYDFIESERMAGDEVIALDAAASVYGHRGWAPTWQLVKDVALVDVERHAPGTWIVYTLPARMRALAPELFQRLSGPPYRTVRIFPATVGGGEILVLRLDSKTGHD
jgi:hypothetical protein